LFDGLADAGALNLHYHLAPAPEASKIALRDRCRSDGIGGELGEDVLGRPQLLRDHGNGRSVGGSGLILEPAELGCYGPRDEVRLGGHGLTELHEQATRVLERVAEGMPQPGAPHLQVVTAGMEEAVANGDHADTHISDRAPDKSPSSADRVRDAMPASASVRCSDELHQNDDEHREHRDQRKRAERGTRREIPQVSDREPEHEQGTRFPHHHGQQRDAPSSALDSEQAPNERRRENEDEQGNEQIEHRSPKAGGR
jgi:hypothetical protein